jgi:hypothetical protein
LFVLGSGSKKNDDNGEASAVAPAPKRKYVRKQNLPSPSSSSSSSCQPKKSEEGSSALGGGNDDDSDHRKAVKTSLASSITSVASSREIDGNYNNNIYVKWLFVFSLSVCSSSSSSSDMYIM